jgi:hypothetical protein
MDQLPPTRSILRRDFRKNPLSYQTPATLLVLPLAPASLARSAHLAPLTPLRPRWGLARFFFGLDGIFLDWVEEERNPGG